MGLERIHTTPYHPQSNGIIEKWHRHLKAALMCVCINITDWYYKLPSVLLDLQTAVGLDTGVSPAEVHFGRALRTPGDFCAHQETEVGRDLFMNEFRQYLKKIKNVPAPNKLKKTPPDFKPFWFKDLDSYSHVLKLVKKVKAPLIRPYTGPHKVIERHPSKKYFKIKQKTVSTDLLKPVYFIPELDDLFEMIPCDMPEPIEQVVDPLPPPVQDPLPNPFRVPVKTKTDTAAQKEKTLT